ncbi:Ig-like domain repeat protein [Aeromicrobium senzhongii]|uniref:Ig-like domain repeat protein n=1 Tax=Aeromicrobium senzhongii TaxID=2663859 RepID=A0ABX6SSK7_9ACTN|nr:Ig-like domain-containing protein [Aeromicrobium senzhongii]QNL94237.1 Ig-like domain repeat protein [Aeromicrobium senzhongii]
MARCPRGGQLSRTIAYRCETIVGGLNLGTRDVAVTATTDYGVIYGDNVLPPSPLYLRLHMPELLRGTVADIVGGRESSGSVPGLPLAVTVNGAPFDLPVGVQFPRSPVPQQAGEPWVLAGRGEVPFISLASDTRGAVTLGLPATFRLDLSVYTDSDEIPSTVSCTGPSDRLIRSFEIEEQPTEGPTPGPTTEPSTVPTTQFTVEPTTAPTTAPTTGPTSGPVLLAPTVKVGAVCLWRSAVFTVGVSAKGTVPTGTVTVKLGDRTVAKGRVFLGVSILTASNLPKGQHTFSITYSGDGKVAAKTVTKVLRIN